LKSLQRGEELGAEVIQIFTQSPRMWHPSPPSAETVDAYRDAFSSQDTVRATFCHATYLINLATPDEEMAERSSRCLVENLVAASNIDSAGLIVHPGSHRGDGFEAAIGRTSERFLKALGAAQSRSERPLCRLLLENTAGAGGTVGRSFEELAQLLDAIGNEYQTGFCLDTQHLFASGVAFATREEADAVVETLDSTLGVDLLGCIHLNDSKVPLGANRDRHANLGDGEIGKAALGWLLSHPLLEATSVLLEVPGSGEGPRRADIETAGEILSAGVARRAGRQRPQEPREPSQ
jgi:deoxyribonuclease IV